MAKDWTTQQKYLALFIGILLVTVAVRAAGLDIVPYDDEGNYMFAMVNNVGIGYSLSHYSGLMAQWTYEPVIKLLGINPVAYRLVPLFFATLTMVAVFLTARRFYDTKVGLIATVIMATSFYHTLGSLQIDIEGGLMTLVYLIAMVTYINLLENTTHKNSILLGLILGLSMLVKHNAIFIYAIIFLYDAWQRWNIWESIKTLFVPFAIGGSIFLLFNVVFAYLTDPFFLAIAWSQGSSRVHLGFSLLSVLLVLFWATPYLLGLGLFSITEKKVLRRDYAKLFALWIVFTLFANTFIISRGDFSKYPMNMTVPIALLGGILLSRLRVTKKELSFSTVIGVLFFALTYVLNTFMLKPVSRVTSHYVAEILQGNFNFLFSYTSPSGPMFGVSFLSIVVMLGASGILMALYYLTYTRPHIRKQVLLAFLAITLAFNIFLINQYLFPTTSPDVSTAKMEMMDYFRTNMSYPLVSNDEGMRFFFDTRYEISDEIDNRSWGIPDNELDATSDLAIEALRDKGNASLLLLNWPLIPEESPGWDFVEYCELEKTFVSKGYEVGYAYRCTYE